MFEAGAAATRRADARNSSRRMVEHPRTNGPGIQPVSQNYETWLYRSRDPGRMPSVSGVDLAGVVPPVGSADPVPQGAGSSSSRWWGPTSLVAQDDRLSSRLPRTARPPGIQRSAPAPDHRPGHVAPTLPTRLQDFYIEPRQVRLRAGSCLLRHRRAHRHVPAASADTARPPIVVRQAPTDAANSVSAPGAWRPPPLRACYAVDFRRRVGASPDPLVPDAVWVTTMPADSADPVPDSLQWPRPGPPLATRSSRSSRCGSSIPATGRGCRVRSATTSRGRSTSPAARRDPDDAVAITGNLTVAGQTSGGYVSVGPTSRPTRRARRSTSRSATTGPTT